MSRKTKHKKLIKKGGRRRRTKKNFTQNKTLKEFKKLNCSPKNQYKDYTCYSEADLQKLKDMWNSRHPDKPIDSIDPKIIWQQLKDYYSSICNKESCWVRQMTKNTKMEKELLEAFAPESPKEWNNNPNEWLSSIDILEVMNQYEKKYKCFDFLGPSPIDYDEHKLYGECVWEELCHFNLADQLKKGHTKFGIIFNLDPHYKGGSHWVSLFINVKKKTIFYFDSAGETCPRQIKKFANMVIEQGKQLPNKIYFNFDENHPIEHQYGNTECGIYSIFFVIHMLEDKITGHYLKTHILKDEYIEKFRNVYYNRNGDVK
jgi:hypothetical protein